MPARFFEDFAVGDEITTATCRVTRDDVLEYARRWDPQPFHVDEAAARASMYGGLIASGLMTVALTFRLFLETGVMDGSSLGSPGLDEIRWLRPVRPDDTLHVVVKVLAARASSSKPDRGVLTVLYTTLNQRRETVMTMTGRQLLRRRPAAS